MTENGYMVQQQEYQNFAATKFSATQNSQRMWLQGDHSLSAPTFYLPSQRDSEVALAGPRSPDGSSYMAAQHIDAREQTVPDLAPRCGPPLGGGLQGLHPLAGGYEEDASSEGSEGGEVRVCVNLCVDHPAHQHLHSACASVYRGSSC